MNYPTIFYYEKGIDGISYKNVNVLLGYSTLNDTMWYNTTYGILRLKNDLVDYKLLHQ